MWTYRVTSEWPFSQTILWIYSWLSCIQCNHFRTLTFKHVHNTWNSEHASILIVVLIKNYCTAKHSSNIHWKQQRSLSHCLPIVIVLYVIPITALAHFFLYINLFDPFLVTNGVSVFVAGTIVVNQNISDQPRHIQV